LATHYDRPSRSRSSPYGGMITPRRPPHPWRRSSRSAST
jgi:hypothetical protein